MNKITKALLVVACSVACTVAGVASAASAAGVAGVAGEKAKAAAIYNRFAVSVKPLTEAEKAHAAAVYAAEPYYESEAAMAAQECDIDYPTPECQLDDYTADDAAAAIK